jgi:hypothetical protein
MFPVAAPDLQSGKPSLCDDSYWRSQVPERDTDYRLVLENLKQCPIGQCPTPILIDGIPGGGPAYALKPTARSAQLKMNHYEAARLDSLRSSLTPLMKHLPRTLEGGRVVENLCGCSGTCSCDSHVWRFVLNYLEPLMRSHADLYRFYKSQLSHPFYAAASPGSSLHAAPSSGSIPATPAASLVAPAEDMFQQLQQLASSQSTGAVLLETPAASLVAPAVDMFQQLQQLASSLPTGSVLPETPAPGEDLLQQLQQQFASSQAAGMLSLSTPAASTRPAAPTPSSLADLPGPRRLAMDTPHAATAQSTMPPPPRRVPAAAPMSRPPLIQPPGRNPATNFSSNGSGALPQVRDFHLPALGAVS